MKGLVDHTKQLELYYLIDSEKTLKDKQQGENANFAFYKSYSVE